MYLAQPTKAGQHCDSLNSKVNRMRISLDIQWATHSNRISVLANTDVYRELISRSSSWMREFHHSMVRFTGTRLWKDVHTTVSFSLVMSFNQAASFTGPDHTDQNNRMFPILRTSTSGCVRSLRTSPCL